MHCRRRRGIGDTHLWNWRHLGHGWTGGPFLDLAAWTGALGAGIARKTHSRMPRKGLPCPHTASPSSSATEYPFAELIVRLNVVAAEVPVVGVLARSGSQRTLRALSDSAAQRNSGPSATTTVAPVPGTAAAVVRIPSKVAGRALAEQPRPDHRAHNAQALGRLRLHGSGLLRSKQGCVNLCAVR